MAHKILQSPTSIYPGEIRAECPEAEATIAVLIRKMKAEGPSPVGYEVKPLGQELHGLWQINLKVEKRQVRILYAPYKQDIVLFRIHKKGSPQEQERAYELAGKRKRDYEKVVAEAERAAKKKSNGRDRRD